MGLLRHRHATGRLGRRPSGSADRIAGSPTRSTGPLDGGVPPRRGRSRGEALPVPSAAMFERTALPDGPRVISARLPGRALGLHRGLRPGRLAPRDAPARPASPTSWSTSRSRARPRYPSTRAISEAIEGVGGSFNAATDRESTVYWVRVPRREADRGDGRPRRAHRPADARRRRDRERADGHHRGDPLVPRRPVRVLPDPVPDRRCSATGRWAARSAATRPASAPCPTATIRDFWRTTYRPANTVVAVAGDLDHDEAVELVGDRVRDRQRRRARASRPRPRCRPGRASCVGKRDTTPGPARASACRRSAATIPTAGRSRCSTPSSATG